MLTPVQCLFLAAFAQLPDQAQFYLAGGTALAEYYFGHRLSFDLDLFTAEGSLILPFSYQIEALGPQYGLGITVVRRFASYVEFAVSADGELLKVDLAQDSPFRLESLVLAVGGIYMSSLPDLCMDKLLAYHPRPFRPQAWSTYRTRLTQFVRIVIIALFVPCGSWRRIMEKRVSAFDVRRGFGQMLQDILKHGDKFIVERHGAPVAVVVPIEVYEQWKQTRERFFATLAAGQTAANLSEEDAATLAAEAVQAVRRNYAAGG